MKQKGFVVRRALCVVRRAFSHYAVRTTHNGFSLLEVLIAVAILSFSLLTLLEFQGQTMFRVGRAEKLSQATFLAHQKMGEVLLELEKEYAQQRVFPEDKEEDGEFDKPHEKFQWEWKVRKVEIPTPGGEEGGPMTAMLTLVAGQIKDMVREVKVTIKWEELGKEKKIDVVTHITKL